MLGILTYLGAGILFNLTDATAKFMTNHVSVIQVVWALYVWTVLLAWFLSPGRRIAEAARTAHPWWQLARALCQVSGAVVFFVALHHLPLADVIAIGFISPFLITALAFWALGEPVTPVRWAACFVGFMGALIILRPGFAGTTWHVVLPLCSSLLYAVYTVITRKLSPRESSATMMFYIGILGVVALTAALAFFWVEPSPLEWAGLVLVGLLGAAATLGEIRAYSLTPVSVLQPFRYCEIVGATLLGLLIFGDFPDLWTWIGTAIIISSGLYVFRTESSDAR